MQKLCLAAGVVFLLGLSSFTQNAEPLPAPDEVILNFSTEGDQRQFHLGELIPVKFSYRASIPDRYIWVSQNNKLTAGRGLEIACSPSAEPVSRWPLAASVDDKFGKMLNSQCGAVMGGGFGGGCADCDREKPLTAEALSLGPVALNTYLRFPRSDTYTCIASSADVTAVSSGEKIRFALLVKSNPVDLKIVEDSGWATSAAIKYAAAYDKLCRGDDVPGHHSLECFDIAARLTYLDTPGSLSAEVKFFDGRSHGWDNGFWEAIQHTSYPVDAVRLLTDRIQDPDVQVSTTLLESLASWELKIESPDAFETASPANYHSQAVEKLRKYVRLLGSRLSTKNTNVLVESAKTYRMFAEQDYCEGQPLIPKQEQKQVLGASGMRP